MSRSSEEQARALVAAEVAFTALTIAAAVGFARLFEGWSFLPPMVLAAIGAHGLGALCRRRGWNLLVAAVISLAGLAELVTLAFYRADSFYGLPSRSVWDAMWADLEVAWAAFANAIAPVPATTGYVVAAVIAVWAAAFLADGFAFRAIAALEAIVPSGILFVFGAALGTDRLRLLVTALWLAAAGFAYALHRSMAQESAGWLAGIRRGTVGSVLRTSAIIGGGVIVAALIVGPALPGAGEKALLDTRTGSSGTRQTVSPLVDIRGRIVDRSDIEAFTVVADGKSYWRLTALDQFDGRIWTSERGYGDADGELGGGLPEQYTTPLTQDVTIVNLDAVWLPAAYSPVLVDSPDRVRFDADTSSLVTRRNAVEPGTRYRVVSRVPVLDPATLQQSTAPPPSSIAKRYLGLPGNFPSNLRQLAADITKNATTPYEKSIALQDYFQTFTYDTTIPAGSSTNAIERFIEAKRGYCEQFAGTYAAFARSLGLPARVAVGFTPGELREDGAFHVLGKHSHAWPEVYFTGLGWVPFEPTPSRGLPGAESYTGIAAAQEGEQPAAPATTAPSVTTVPGGVNTGTVPDPDLDAGALPTLGGLGTNETSGSSATTWLLGLALVTGVLLVLAAAWLVVAPRLARARWDKRRRAARTGADRVLVSWHETTDVLARGGEGAQPSETPLEYASRLSEAGMQDAPLVQAMAADVTVAAYARDDVPDDVVGRTDDTRRELEHRRWARASLADKVRWLADPRPLLRRRLPGDAEPAEETEPDRAGEAAAAENPGEREPVSSA